MHTYLAARPPVIAGGLVPKSNFAAAEVNSGRPVIGKYSWSKDVSLNKISFAFAYV